MFFVVPVYIMLYLLFSVLSAGSLATAFAVKC